MKQLIPFFKRSFPFGLVMSILMIMSINFEQSAISASDSFPENWQGTWSGILIDRRSRTVGGTPKLSVPMTLRIQPISNNPMRYTWQIIYGAGEKKIVRNYELVAKDQSTGHFVIDEKDGTLIDSWWLGGKLYSQFRVNDLLLSTQCERQGNRLHQELVVYQLTSSPQAKGSQETASFESYQLKGVQSAELLSVKE